MKRLLPFLLTIYVSIDKPSGESLREYEGMSIATVRALLTSEGYPFTFLTKAEYQTKLDQKEAALDE